MKGSGAEFFSGPHKSLPTVDSLNAALRAGEISQETHDRVLQVLGDWEAHGQGLPEARPFDVMYRPFDVMYRLGLEKERSDYDLNFSSDTMFRRGLARWSVAEFGTHNADGSLKVPVSPTNHGYLDKYVVRAEFPNLYRWAKYWERELKREMSYAVFLSRGPRRHHGAAWPQRHLGAQAAYRLDHPTGAGVMMPAEIALQTSARGKVDRVVLEQLRAELGLERAGRLTDAEDAEFGYREEQVGATRLTVNLWRHTEDIWSYDLFYEGQPPPADVVDRYQTAFRGAFTRVGFVIHREYQQ